MGSVFTVRLHLVVMDAASTLVGRVLFLGELFLLWIRRRSFAMLHDGGYNRHLCAFEPPHLYYFGLLFQLCRRFHLFFCSPRRTRALAGFSDNVCPLLWMLSFWCNSLALSSTCNCVQSTGMALFAAICNGARRIVCLLLQHEGRTH